MSELTIVDTYPIISLIVAIIICIITIYLYDMFRFRNQT